MLRVEQVMRVCGAVERFENASRRIPATSLNRSSGDPAFFTSFGRCCNRLQTRFSSTRDAHSTIAQHRNASRNGLGSVLKTQICVITDRDCRQCAGYVAELRLYFSSGVCAVFRSTTPAPLGEGAVLFVVYHVLCLSRSYGDSFL